MGRICAWCGSILSRSHATDAPVTHAICAGCRVQLVDALDQAGLRLSQNDATPH